MGKVKKIVRLVSGMRRCEWEHVKRGIDRAFDEKAGRTVFDNKDAAERALWFVKHP